MIAVKAETPDDESDFGLRWLFRHTEIRLAHFAQELIAQWGGAVQEWKRTFQMSTENGYIHKARYKIDQVVVTDEKVTLLGIKSKYEPHDIEWHLESAGEYEYREKPDKPIEKAILTFYITAPARQMAEEHGIRIIEPL